MFKLTTSLLAAAIVAFAPHAKADTVVFSNFAHSSETVTVTLSGVNPALNLFVPAGGFLTTLNGGPSFESYCVDLYQNIAFNTPYNDYTPPGTSHAFINPNAYLDLGRLFANVGPVFDSIHEAAFQIAVWEIAYENGPGYDLTLGAATFSGGTAASSGALGIASTWLSTLGNGTGSIVKVLESPGHQDVITAVPEPETYLLMLVGMAGLGFVAKRRGNASRGVHFDGGASA